MRRIGLAVLGAVVLLGGSVSGVLATTTRIHVSTPPQAFTVLDPGVWTMNGSVQSVRGLVARDDGTWNNVYADGPAINTINWDLDLATGGGSMWGTGVHAPTAFPGAQWLCDFHATFANYGFTGKGVCHGTGSLHTWQWRVDLTQAPGQGTAADGYIFKPGD